MTMVSPKMMSNGRVGKMTAFDTEDFVKEVTQGRGFKPELGFNYKDLATFQCFFQRRHL